MSPPFTASSVNVKEEDYVCKEEEIEVIAESPATSAASKRYKKKVKQTQSEPKRGKKEPPAKKQKKSESSRWKVAGDDGYPREINVKV